MGYFFQKFGPFHGLHPSHKMDQTTTGKRPIFSQKKSCSIFFEKRIFRFFSRNFRKDFLKTLLRGRKTMNWKYWVFPRYLRNFCKNVFFHKKKSCSKFFEKEYSNFFSRNFPKDVSKIFLRGWKRINWKCWVVFEILRNFCKINFFAKKKLVRYFLKKEYSDFFIGIFQNVS